MTIRVNSFYNKNNKKIYEVIGDIPQKVTTGKIPRLADILDGTNAERLFVKDSETIEECREGTELHVRYVEK